MEALTDDAGGNVRSWATARAKSLVSYNGTRTGVVTDGSEDEIEVEAGHRDRRQWYRASVQ